MCIYIYIYIIIMIIIRVIIIDNNSNYNIYIYTWYTYISDHFTQFLGIAATSFTGSRLLYHIFWIEYVLPAIHPRVSARTKTYHSYSFLTYHICRNNMIVYMAYIWPYFFQINLKASRAGPHSTPSFIPSMIAAPSCIVPWCPWSQVHHLTDKALGNQKSLSTHIQELKEKNEAKMAVISRKQL